MQGVHDKEFANGLLARRMPLGNLVIFAVLVISIWIWLNYLYVKQNGVFHACGIDYALFITGSRLIHSDHPIDVFDRDAIVQELRGFATYYGKTEPGDDQIGPLPYPVPMFWLYTPFSYLDPIRGFKFWVVVNLLIAGFVVWRLCQPLGGLRAIAAACLALGFAPMTAAIFFGQPVAVLLLAFYLAYRSLQRGKDFQAGLFAGLLFLKVQYPMVLLLVLALHRRWQAVAGMAVTGSVLLFTSLIVCGLRWIPAYLDLVQSMSGFREGASILWPTSMINWRGFLVRHTQLNEELGKVITTGLSLVTLASLLLIWRGPWQATSPRFSLRMVASLLVTILSAYHSHIHGAALLLVPALDFLVTGAPPRLIRYLFIGGYIVTLFMVWATGWGATTAVVVHTAMLTCLLAILYWEVLGQPTKPACNTR
jgi:hypothetical protein